MPVIEIYTQDWCGFCARAKQLLDRKGATYREIDAPNGTPERAEATARSGELVSRLYEPSATQQLYLLVNIDTMAEAQPAAPSTIAHGPSMPPLSPIPTHKKNTP